MKKIIVAVALLVAGLVQASQVNWTLATPVDAGGSKVRIWTFIASDSSGSTAKTISQADAIALITAGDYATLKTYNQKGGVLTDTGTFTGSYTTDNASWGANVTVSGYAIVFDSTDKNLDGVANYMVTDLQTVKFTNVADVKSLGVTPSGTWTAVPEPTSALLMLIGVAGLALRRRRV